jgi:N-methylhydantoinase A/oxoprolinase/acetone carboxylase beta subunit
MVNLGWPRSEGFLGGDILVNPELARQAFAGVAVTLDMTVEEASMGAVQILSSLMVQAIEQNSVRKGFDPRDFALVAEGGAGPLFSAQIGVEVGTPYVIVPPHPGITSAMGLLATDMVYEYGSTVYQRMSQLDREALQAAYADLERQAQEQLEADGVEPENMAIQRIAECRYLGQGYELRVDAPSGEIDDEWLGRIREAFNHNHEREYSRSFPDADIEIPNVRVRGVGLMPDLRMPDVEAGAADAGHALRAEHLAWFPVDGTLQHLPTRFYDRDALQAGNRIEGPAIVNQYDSTTVIPPGLEAEIDHVGNIVIRTNVGDPERARASEAVADR